MSTDGEQKPSRGRSVPLRLLIIAALVAGLAALVWINDQSVPVRPFGTAPLNRVIAVPLLVGIVIGWYIRSLIAARAASRRAAAASRSSS